MAHLTETNFDSDSKLDGIVYFAPHRFGLGSLFPISVWDRNPNPNRSPSPVMKMSHKSEVFYCTLPECLIMYMNGA